MLTISTVSNAQEPDTARYVNAQWQLELSYSNSIFYELDRSELPQDVLIMLNPKDGDFPMVAVTGQARPLPASLTEDLAGIYKDSGLITITSPELVDTDTVRISYKEASDGPTYVSTTRYLGISSGKHIILTLISTEETQSSPAGLSALQTIKQASQINTVHKKNREVEARRNIFMMLFPGVLLLVFFIVMRRRQRLS